MQSAAKETTGDEAKSEMPEPPDYPTHDKKTHETMKEIKELLNTRLPETPQSPAVPPEDSDRYILMVLDTRRGKPFSINQIVQMSMRMEQEDRTKIRRLTDYMIRTRIPILMDRGLIARPPGRVKKVLITPEGTDALIFACANSTQSQR
jgi:hypothetical protein